MTQNLFVHPFWNNFSRDTLWNKFLNKNKKEEDMEYNKLWKKKTVATSKLLMYFF